MYEAAALAAVATSTALDPAAAAEEAAAAAMKALAGPLRPGGFATVLAAISTAYGPIDRRVPDALRGVLGEGCRVAGLHTEGVLAEGLESSRSPAVAVVAFGGLEAVPCLLDHVRGHEDEVAEQLETELGPMRASDLVLLACDAHELDPAALAGGLQRCAPASVVGVGVEGPSGSRALHFVDDEIAREGVLAVRIRGNHPVALRRALGARALDERLVTLSRGHWCLSIDGEPALDAFRAAAGRLGDDPLRAARSVLAFVGGGSDSVDPECARSVVGFDEDEGAIGLSQPVQTGESIRFAIRDPLMAREALAATAEELSGLSMVGEAGLGLATSCRTRGAALFGEVGLESAYLSLAFRGEPWLGLVGSLQLLAAPGIPAQLLNLSGTLARLS